MRIIGVVLIVVGVAAAALQLIPRGQARRAETMPMPHGVMMAQPMTGMMAPMRDMMAPMHATMTQMSNDVQAMRRQLDTIDPDQLTQQERSIYEYLQLMQTHLEAMDRSMGSMHGMMTPMGR